MVDEVKLICENCGAEKFYCNPMIDSKLIFDGKKFICDVAMEPDIFDYWYCSKCDDGATEEQCEMLSEKYGGERWIKQTVE